MLCISRQTKASIFVRHKSISTRFFSYKMVPGNKTYRHHGFPIETGNTAPPLCSFPTLERRKKLLNSWVCIICLIDRVRASQCYLSQSEARVSIIPVQTKLKLPPVSLSLEEQWHSVTYMIQAISLFQFLFLASEIRSFNLRFKILALL